MHSAARSVPAARSAATYRLSLALTALVAVGLAAYAVAFGTVAAAVIFAIPYVVLLIAARGVKPWGVGVILALLLAGTGFGLWSAGSSSTGGLAFLWLCPLQILVATTCRADLFRYDEDL
jgi:hypothetical protein